MNILESITDYDEVMRTVLEYRKQVKIRQAKAEEEKHRLAEAKRLYQCHYYMEHRDERLAYQNRYNRVNHDKVKEYQDLYRDRRRKRKQNK